MFAQADSPYSKQVDEIISELKTHPEEGLSEQEVLVRLKEFGRNRLKEKKKISPLFIYLNQYKDFMMLILMVVAAVSFLIHDKEDGIEWKSVDQRPAHLITLIISPQKDAGTQLRLLTSIARLIKKKGVAPILLNTDSPRDLLEFFHEMEEKRIL